MNQITATRLRSLLRYSKTSGLFYEAGTNTIRHGHNLNGYRAYKIDGQIYYGHRLAWLYITGEWPTEHIDHKNCHRHDNRWINLRIGGYVGNSRNRRAKTGSRLGFKGVALINDRPRRKPYQAKIVVNGKRIYLGYFATPEEAHRVYVIAAKKYFGRFARAS